MDIRRGTMVTTHTRTFKIMDEVACCLTITEDFEQETVTLNMDGLGGGSLVIPREMLPHIIKAFRILSREAPPV